MKRKVRCILYIGILVAVGCMSYLHRDFHLAFHLERDTEEYDRWLFCQTNDFEADLTKEYLISTYIDTEKNLNVDYANNVTLGENLETVLIKKHVDYNEIMFQSNGLLMDLDCGIEEDRRKVHAFQKNNSKAQKWRIKKTEDGDAFFIMIGDGSALSSDKNMQDVYIRPFTGNDDQKWVIR